MKLIDDLNTIHSPYSNAVITIGNFDGVHIGHQELFAKTIEKARSMGGTSVAITFNPHPASALGYDTAPLLITPHEQKLELISALGVDVLISIPFTRQFSDISADEFVENCLVKKIGMKAIVVGDDYSYGSRRTGNLATLHADAKRLGFEIILVHGIVNHGEERRVSSTRIRELILEGNMTEAEQLLGRPYQIRGAVVRGRNRGGRLLGFPTANIQLKDELRPKTGVYAVTCECFGKNYGGVANIGYSPTFDDNMYTIEIHLLDFNRDIYGEKLHVNFVRRLRDETKFSDLLQLEAQIAKDIRMARKILTV